MRKRNIRVTAEGQFARIMQHEIDHLDGSSEGEQASSSTFARRTHPTFHHVIP